MDPCYTRYSIINNIVRAYDTASNNVGKRPLSVPTSRKRSRDEWEEEENDDIFNELFTILCNDGVFSTLRALVLACFYSTVARNSDNHYYEQIVKIIVDFRFTIAHAEALYNGGDRQGFYFYIVDDLVTFLRRSKHTILLFQLSSHP
jgi:hypothetical protein